MNLHRVTVIGPAIAGIWTLIVWGSRVRLLSGAARSDAGSWFRIGGSLAFAFVLLLLALIVWRSGAPSVWFAPVSWGFLAFTVAVWIPSLLRVMPGTESVAFKSVHAALAVVSLGIAGALARLSTR